MKALYWFLLCFGVTFEIGWIGIAYVQAEGPTASERCYSRCEVELFRAVERCRRQNPIDQSSCDALDREGTDRCEARCGYSPYKRGR